MPLHPAINKVTRAAQPRAEGLAHHYGGAEPRLTSGGEANG